MRSCRRRSSSRTGKSASCCREAGAVRGGQRTRRGLPHQRTDRLAAAARAEASACCSGDGGGARRGRARQARGADFGGHRQSALQRVRRRLALPEEEGLVEPYKEGLQAEWGIRKFNLDDSTSASCALPSGGSSSRRVAAWSATSPATPTYPTPPSSWSDAAPRRFRRHLDRQPERRQPRDRQADAGPASPDPRCSRPNLTARASVSVPQSGFRAGATARAGTPPVRYANFWGVRKREELVASLDDPPSPRATLKPHRGPRIASRFGPRRLPPTTAAGRGSSNWLRLRHSAA